MGGTPVTQCQHCNGRANNAFLCRQCEHELRDMLTDLYERTATNLATGETRPAPGGLELLHDEAVGDTQKGESVRHSTEFTSPMPCNLTASQLYDDIHNTLQRWSELVSLHTETLTIPGKDEQ